MKISLLIGLVLVSFVVSSAADAFTFSDGTSATCTDYRGQTVIERAQPSVAAYGQQMSAVTTAGAGPNPSVITYGTVMFSHLPPVAKDFLFFHECAHARVPTSDELQANCQGLVAMRSAGRSSAAIENQLASFHSSLGYMGPAYGVGATFWTNTVACANQSSPMPPIPTPPPPPQQPVMTMRCYFNYGPLAGHTIDYTGYPGAIPAVVGGPCHDGPSMGVGVP